MKFIKNISPLLFLSLLFVTCEKVISIENIDTPRKLVVNSANQPETPWQIHISNSANLTDNSGPENLENALVLLQDETLGNLDTLPYLMDGYYGNGTMPLVGHEYTLNVQAESFTSVRASSLIPNFPQLDSITFSWDEYLNDTVLLVNLVFQDEQNIDNYYLINTVATIYPGSSAEESQSALIYSLDKNTDNADIGDEATAFRYLYIKDSKLPTSTYSIAFYVDLEEIRNNNAPYCLSIILQSVSESLYLHLKSYEQYEDNNTASNFPLQVQVYGNIENGFGIFGGYAKQEEVICF